MGLFNFLFGKSKKNKAEQDNNNISKQENPLYPEDRGKYSLTDNEIEFFDAFYTRLLEAKIPINKIKSTRLGDGVVNVEYNRCQVGRVKLFGRKFFMQILDADDIKVLKSEGAESLHLFISQLNHWIKYIKFIIKYDREFYGSLN